MQLEQNTPIIDIDDNASGNFWSYGDEKSTLEEQNIENDYRNLVGKSSDTESYTRDGLSDVFLKLS